MRQGRRRIDPASHTPLYHQLADILRDEIRAEHYPPGERLPAEHRLAQEFELGVDTVRQALAVLRREGLIVTRRGRWSEVPARGEPTVIPLGPGVDITTRMPTEDERRSMDLAEGVPVFVIHRPGEPDEIVPGGPSTILRTGGDAPPPTAT